MLHDVIGVINIKVNADTASLGWVISIGSGSECGEASSSVLEWGVLADQLGKLGEAWENTQVKSVAALWLWRWLAHNVQRGSDDERVMRTRLQLCNISGPWSSIGQVHTWRSRKWTPNWLAHLPSTIWQCANCTGGANRSSRDLGGRGRIWIVAEQLAEGQGVTQFLLD